MGILDRLRSAFGRSPLIGRRYEYPAPGLAGPAAMFAQAIADLWADGSEDIWLTIETIPDAGEDVRVVQVAGRHLNTLVDEIDIQTVLTSAGHGALAGKVRRQADALYELGTDDPEEFAAAIDAVFVRHYGLRPGYPVRAVVDC
ncbi:MAG: hypothetical protein ACF8R7_02315 [Phycisphaerales bacterium JB039]